MRLRKSAARKAAEPLEGAKALFEIPFDRKPSKIKECGKLVVND
jgi:hypothetical protein